MRPSYLVAAAVCVMPMAGCATATLNADKSFVATQASFLTLQQVALAGIKSGTITGATKNRVIDLIVEGQRYENLAYQTRSLAALAGLTSVINRLTAEGVR